MPDRINSKTYIMERVGDISQLAGARSGRLCGGKADGMPVIDFRTGTGFNFSVLPGRNMDIAWAEYNGHAISFISKTGVVNGAYYEHDYDGFHRNFFAGLLTTCGLRNIGGGCEDGEPLGLHGRISNIPAENVSIQNGWEEDRFVMRATGETRESKLYCENLRIKRTISAEMNKAALTINDEVENCGFRDEPMTILYHFNFGYPLLDTTAKVILPDGEVIPRDTTAEAVKDRYDVMETPQNGFPETVFFHRLNTNQDGMTYAALYNPALGSDGLGAAMIFNGKALPFLTEWKNMGKGDYVVALEPGNCYPMGRKMIRERGELEFLAPQETRNFQIEFRILNGTKDLDELRKIV